MRPSDKTNPIREAVHECECVALIPTRSRRCDLEQAVTAGCDHFVPGSVVDAALRGRLRRLAGTALAAPFLAAAVLATTYSGQGPLGLLGALCAAFAIGWSIVLLVAATGRARLAEDAALVAATLVLATMIASAGGLASPVVALLLVLPIEANWISRRPHAARWGGLAALAALALHWPIAAAVLADAGGAASPWHWIAPLAYAATVLARLPAIAARPQELAAGQKTFRLEDHIPAAVMRLAGNGDVIDVSPQSEDLLGIQPELLLGQGLFERIRISDRVAYRCALSDLAENPAVRTLELSLRLPHRGQGASHRLFQAEMMGSGDGQAVAILRPADALGALRAALARADEATGATELAKGRFLATVSHELRTPLNAIIGFSDMMLHEAISGPLAPRQKEHVTLIREAGRHLLSVVNSILDISKIEAGTYRLHPETFRFATSAELCLSMLEPLVAEKQLKMTSRIAASLDEVNCDQRAVQQILNNLLSNAIKFTPAGGSVAFEAGIDDDRLAIRISDTGIGMSEEELASIGKPFAQVSNDYTRQYEGTGLGLCLVRGLVELHGGTMSIESAPGLGTAVTVTLPQSIENTEGHDGETQGGKGAWQEGEINGFEHETLREIA
jgi:two-component system, cell cycle sensor histidine kinase DivJ